MIKSDKEVFVEKAIKVHGNKYNYSKVEYVNNHTKVCIICPEHGEFWQVPNSHLNGSGCPACSGLKRLTKEEFIKRANEVHGGKYDYSQSNFISTHQKIDIVCPIHGVFTQLPKNHLKGQGCPSCGKKYAQEWQKNDYIHFVEESKKRFGDIYDFPNIEEIYENHNSIINIHCKKCGAFFSKTAKYHLSSPYGGCKCYLSKPQSDKRVNIKPCITKPSRLIDVSLIQSKIEEKFPSIKMVNPQSYKNQSTPTEFACLKCGHTFFRKSNTFLCANLYTPCPNCTKISLHHLKTKTQEQFFQDVIKRYGDDKYQLVSEYISSSDPIKVKCLDCGRVFEIEANSFLQGHGCPYHNCNSSLMEKDLFSFIHNICNDAIQNDRSVLNGQELDIYIPSKHIAFEFDGIFWHNENNKPNDYHINKTRLAQEKGVRLIHIFEDEWVSHKDIWQSMIRHLLGVTSTTIYARKCTVNIVDPNIANLFLKQNHIQGWCPSSIKLGLFWGDELVSLMTFGKSRHFIGNGNTEWELLRFCNKLNTKVVGSASKLFNYFTKEYKPNSIVSYADMRWSTGNVYNKLGFTLSHISKPNYYYIINNIRKNRFNFRKSVLVKKYNCPENMSERDFCFSQKWYRIYDCGCMVYYKNIKNF